MIKSILHMPEEPIHHPKNAGDHGTAYDDFHLGIAEFSRLYTVGQLTLCQAVNGLRAYVMNVSGGIIRAKLADVIIFVGHRFSEQDEYHIELGFGGDIDAWLDDGNLPQGWYSLFADNYPSYCRELKPKEKK